jgi:hypothetical protein
MALHTCYLAPLGGGAVVVSATMLHLCGVMQGLDLVVCASSDETAIKKVIHGCSCMHQLWAFVMVDFCSVMVLCYSRQAMSRTK